MLIKLPDPGTPKPPFSFFTGHADAVYLKGYPSCLSRPEIVSLCMDTGMKTGFLHGSKPTALTRKGSLFCFSGPSMPNDKRTGAIMDLLVPHLHLSLSQILSKMPSAEKNIVLSPREKEVLKWNALARLMK